MILNYYETVRRNNNSVFPSGNSGGRKPYYSPVLITYSISYTGGHKIDSQKIKKNLAAKGCFKYSSVKYSISIVSVNILSIPGKKFEHTPIHFLSLTGKNFEHGNLFCVYYI